MTREAGREGSRPAEGTGSTGTEDASDDSVCVYSVVGCALRCLTYLNDCRVGKGNTHLPCTHSVAALHLPHTTIPPAIQHGSSLSSRRLTLAGSAQVQAEVAARHQALAVAVAVQSQSQSQSQSHFLLHLHPRSSCTPSTPNCSHDDKTGRDDAGTTRRDKRWNPQGRSVRANGLFTLCLDTVSCIYLGLLIEVVYMLEHPDTCPCLPNPLACANSTTDCYLRKSK